jgi:hypothetical protein
VLFLLSSTHLTLPHLFLSCLVCRSGKGSLPDGGLLLEQVDEVRAEIDRVSQERAQSMQELQQERMHSRQRHQQLVDSITAALQSRDASLGALHRLELFCRDQGLDLSGLAVYEVRPPIC